MSNTLRIVIVAALAVAVAAVVATKERDQSDSDNPPAAAISSTSAPAAPLPRLVDLGASKCIPCKMMAPILEELKTEYAGRLEVEFIDVWKDSAAAEKYDIESIPTQIFFDHHGKERFRHQGFFSREDILAKCRELGMLPSTVPAG